MPSSTSAVIQVSSCWNHLIKTNILELIVFLIIFLDQVMETDNWKKLKEENLAVLCDLQQMVLTALTI